MLQNFDIYACCCFCYLAFDMIHFRTKRHLAFKCIRLGKMKNSTEMLHTLQFPK